MSTNEERAFNVPSWNMHKLQEKINKINNKAKKLNCPEVSFEILEKFQRNAPGYENQEYAPKITIYKIAIHGEGPKINGWKFIGTLDHYSLPGSVIVNTVPGESIPEEFYNHDAVCDHCGKIRRRIETFIVEDKNKSFKQVGRQCLKDFLGHDPKGIASYLTSIRIFIGDLEDEEGWERGGSYHEEYLYDHIEVLKTAAAVIRCEGWLSRSNAQTDLDGRPATADIVLNVFNPPTDRDARRTWEKWVDGLKIDQPRNQKDAEEALEWLNNQTENRFNEYMHNLHQIAGADGVPTKMFGYWCSLVSSYYRAQEKMMAEKALQKLNEYFGNVNDRVEINIEVAGIKNIPGNFGGYSIIKMHDTDGHTIIWITSSDVGMEIGHKYNIKGTIKKHEEYNDWKQTYLTRVKVLKEIGE